MFPFTILLALISLLLWTRFGFALPVIIIGIVAFLQLLTLLLSVPAFFDETKYNYLLPSLYANLIAAAVWILLIIVYGIKMAINHFIGTGGKISNASGSIYLPGIPSYGFGNTALEGLSESKFFPSKKLLFLHIHFR